LAAPAVNALVTAITINTRSLARAVITGVLSLAVATLVVGFFRDTLGVPNPSAIYLVAVVATALVAGALGGAVASVAAFLLYNFYFTEPRHTFAINEPSEWLNVVILLFVGIVVGQLAASMRSRAETGRRREREARALFRLSRALATRLSTDTALNEICDILASETRVNAVRIGLGSESSERVAAAVGNADAWSRPGPVPSPSRGVVNVLRRMPAEEPARWIKVHQGTSRVTGPRSSETFRVRIEAADAALGSIWALRDRALGMPDATETRLLSAAADQIGQALVQDRFASESQAVEIARQSDALKSALLQSVSHDLRTPLATIRAASGTLSSNGLNPEAVRESARAIDREAEYLNRLVTNLLDLSRIDADALKADTDAFELDDALARALERVRPRLGYRRVEIALRAPAVAIDPVLLDDAFTNVLDNVIRHTSPDAPLRIQADALDDRTVRLSVEDGGAGVPDGALGRLFDKFYRVPARRSEREGTGIGLAVARGMVEAMGGHVSARRSDLGGLAIDFDLPRAKLPVELRTPRSGA
jgi:two-component system sensor histidine kinase KdpD